MAETPNTPPVATPAVVKPDHQAAEDAKAAGDKKAIVEPKDEKAADKVRKYRLLPERSHWVAGKKLQPGDVVELTERQAFAFRDKFEKA